ncbi:MAG: carboxylating nicotinate-nucleotide diphosphorylase [Verrucomicrobia bacterium]|jgi:nicotinate-nucleotide pyrophosphorylase (carboxylating)|nr:MAG: carboxylating nicotinate-nucleotide diphosphorylase [Verrucomicrobiota bacterium]MDH4470853.1 carboxylating nicotinate-nucleotide diphosphorylase [Verrucomicrobiae bacterium]
MLSASYDLIKMAIAEDVGSGDITSLAFIPATHSSRGRIMTRQSLVVAGMSTALEVFENIDPQIIVKPHAHDGEKRDAGETLLELEGSTRSLLCAERVVLNFLGRLSGIATTTRIHVDAVEGTGVTILDTRKMTPGWRLLEKEAVRAGGGKNHRMGLYDAILIKDNHLAALGADSAFQLPGYLKKARWKYPNINIEVEADTIEQVEVFLKIPEITTVLLDNMSLEMLRAAVALRNKKAPAIRLEASGGIGLKNLLAVAQTGIDEISLGALTHSAAWADLSLELF